MGKRAWGCFNFPSALAVVQVAARLELVKDTVAFLLLDLLASSTMLCSVSVKCPCCRSPQICVCLCMCVNSWRGLRRGTGAASTIICLSSYLGPAQAPLGPVAPTSMLPTDSNNLAWVAWLVYLPNGCYARLAEEH